MVGFSVFGSFCSLKQAKIEGEFCSSFGKASWRSITWRIRALEHFKTPCQAWKGVAKAISSKMEENKAFRKAKTSNWQGVPNFGKVCQTFAGCDKFWQGVPNFRRVCQTFAWCAKITSWAPTFEIFLQNCNFPFCSFCNR